MGQMELSAEFVDKWNAFLESEGIDDVVLHNWDDKKMGYVQLMKFVPGENDEKILVLVYSAKGEILCPGCQEKAGHCDN